MNEDANVATCRLAEQAENVRGIETRHAMGCARERLDERDARR
jgi:hypothetical protein